MRPFSSTKKPVDLSSPSIGKKAPQSKQTNETENPRKLVSSRSTRLLNVLTSNPLSKRGNSPVNSTSPRNLQRCPAVRDLTPKSRQQNFENMQAKGVKKNNNKIVHDFRAFENDEEAKATNDFRLREEEYQGVPSTKCTDKESDNCSVNEGIEEDEKELEKIMGQLEIFGPRRSHRGTLKHKEMFEQLNSSFNQEDKKTFRLKMPLPEKEDLNNKQTLKSNVIEESPLDQLATRRDEFCTGNSETESVEQSFDKPEEKRAMSDIWNDTPRAERLVELRVGKGKSKINLEIYLAIENLLREIKEALAREESILEIFGEYISIVHRKDAESFEKIFRNENESKLIKSSFVLERLAIVLALYFMEELKAEQNVDLLIGTLVTVIYENCVLFGYLLSQKLKENDVDNMWTDKLLDVIGNGRGDIVSTKEESFAQIHKNNSILADTMKNMIITLQNKEVLYGYNSIIVQLDRIPINEAYSRMLKCLSLYTSQLELKGQNQKLKGSSVKKRTTDKIFKEQKSVMSSKDSSDLERSREIKKNTKEELVSYYLPKLSEERTYTLVLDLDETLVHFAEIPGQRNELRVRPYVDYFLTEVSRYYEVIVFTTGIQEYADWVLDNIDTHLTISYRLYRHHASTDQETSSFIKDLSKLGRDLSKVIIVDNLSENFRLQPDNGIAIKPWYDDHEDNALAELAPLLVEIARKNFVDVRVALTRFREQMIANIENGVENPHLNLNLDDC